MSSNFLSLNPSKTEFLIYGLYHYDSLLNSIILPFIYQSMPYYRLLAIMVSSFIVDKQILLFLNHASTIFVTYIRNTIVLRIQVTNIVNILSALLIYFSRSLKNLLCDSLQLNLYMQLKRIVFNLSLRDTRTKKYTCFLVRFSREY